MFPFSKNISFGAVNLDYLHAQRLAAFRKPLLAVMDLLAKGEIHGALPLHRYPLSQVEDAYRFMQNGKHMCKIVVEMDENASVQVKRFWLILLQS